MSTLSSMTRMTGPAKLKSSDSSAFESAAEVVMRQVQAAFMQAITNVQAEISNSADLYRAIGINPRLAWQVYRIAHAENPVLDAVEVPKPAG